MVAVAVTLFASRDDTPLSGALPTSVTYSSPHSSSQPVKEAKTVALGQPVPDASFVDLSGQARRLSQWRGKMALLFFADTTCPCVQAYNERMKALQAKFAPSGLRIAYVFPQASESRAQIRRLAQAQKYPWPCVPDPDQKLLSLFNVQCTTEVFLIDGAGKLRYHGHVDDSTFAPDEAKAHDLQNAIEALIANKSVARPETNAYACTIMRKNLADRAKPPAAKRPL